MASAEKKSHFCVSAAFGCSDSAHRESRHWVSLPLTCAMRFRSAAVSPSARAHSFRATACLSVPPPVQRMCICSPCGCRFTSQQGREFNLQIGSPCPNNYLHPHVHGVVELIPPICQLKAAWADKLGNQPGV